jgi:hypothetical protein
MQFMIPRKAMRFALGLLVLIPSSQILANHNSANNIVVIEAESVTGWNRLQGEARYRWEFLPAPLDLAGANTAGAHNDSGPDPLPLTPFSPDDTVLVTVADPFLEVVFPGFSVAVVDPANLNVPLRDVATWVSGNLGGRVTLPYQSAAAIATQAQADPADPDPITLGDWLEGKGQMRIRCRNNGTARLTIRVRNLIANRAYTVWGMWYRADGRIFPQPFGGTPNGYVTDENGNARYARELNFCPIEAANNSIDGNRILSIITHLHSDHIFYGAIPAPSGIGLPPGAVTHMQLEWNFPGAGTRLID